MGRPVDLPYDPYGPSQPMACARAIVSAWLRERGLDDGLQHRADPLASRSDASPPQETAAAFGLSVEGAVDSLTRWGATGWAWMPAAPDQAVQVEAVLDGRVIGHAVADQMRPDLAENGKGTGRYGFTLAFEGSPTSDSVPMLRVLGLEGPTVLSGAEWSGAEWSSVAGYVDSLTRWGAIGWAWMPTVTDQAMQVEAVLDGRVIGRAVADQMRQDIAASGRGSGRYGFTLSFDEPLTDDKIPQLRVLGPGDPSILRSPGKLAPAEPEGPLASRSDASPPQETAAAFGLSVEGAVDSLTRWGATGWAWMPAAPDQAVQIEAVLDGRVIGHAVADQMRPDLAENGKGTGRYGFILGFNEPLTGNQAPLLRVLGPEGPTALPGAAELMPETPAHSSNVPSALADVQDGSGSLLPNVEGHVDNLTRRDAAGWAWIPSAPDKAVQIEAVLGGRVIGRVIADQMRTDLLQWGKGTGLYGFKVSFDELITGNEAPQLRGLAAVGKPLPGVTSLPPLTPSETVLRTRGSLTTLFKEHAQFTFSGPAFEDFDPSILTAGVTTDSDVRRPLLVAFFLPQFHSIPENDRFWGKGFTEWRQLLRGISRFPGHYQPRIPRDLGFYNLGSLDALRAQADLAKAAGIHAFAFYYYWFNRQRVLERPLDMLLASELEMPFLIIWANENWTKTWDGSESHILLKQDYNPEDEDTLLQDFARHFMDPRYVRLNNRPLFIIYNPKNIPDAALTIARWRNILNTRFNVNPLIFMAQTFGGRDPRPYGLDGAIEFPPHKLSDKLSGRPTPDAYSTDFAGRVIAYDDFVNASLTEDDPAFPLIKTIVPSWDNDARRPNRGLTLENLSPRKYEAWLHELILRAIDTPTFDIPIVAINAWNEWAESAYLEPDVHFGSSFLNATARAYVSAVIDSRSGPLRPASVAGGRSGVSAILPNYNHARYLPERIMSVVQQSLPPDEIIFLDDCSSDDSINVARELLTASHIPFRIVANTENSGCVFRQWIKGMSLARNELIWIAETDDSADPDFLRHVLPGFAREDVMASFGRILCIDETGTPRSDLDTYYNGLNDFSWNSSRIVPAYQAFSHDFSIRNVIPNASGLVFRKPQLTNSELDRLYQYRFAGDWFFYALVTRGGAIAYSRKARSLFRINQSSTSRNAFFTERHLAEHKMVVDDLWNQYGIGSDVVDAHADALAVHFPDRSRNKMRDALRPLIEKGAHIPIRVCIAAHSFAVGGGEVLPLELANELKSCGFHITYLVVERSTEDGTSGIRARLRPDIPVVYWQDVSDRFGEFLLHYGIEVINSHNVSVEYQLFLRKIAVDIPYVASLHGGYETVPDLLTPDFVTYLNRTVTRWLYLADKNKSILVEKGVLADAFQHSFNAVPQFSGEWIDRRDFREKHNISSAAFVLVLCSRAIEEKGWRTAIDVVNEITRISGRSAHLVLIGDGPIAAELRANNANSHYITFMGHVDNPIRYFRCFDAGIFPSTFSGETFPLFLLECFEAGLPVIATDIGEIPRIMGDDAAFSPGAIVDHLNQRDGMCRDMVRFIRSLLADRDAYATMCVHAHEASKRFSMTTLADLYQGLLRELVDTLARSPTRT